MSFNERRYQTEAVDAAAKSAIETGVSLWQMPTGAGKAYCIALLIGEIEKRTGSIRTLVIVDQTVLVSQLRKTFRAALPGANVGVACTGIQKNKSVGCKITIGTRQTIAADMSTLDGGYDLVVVDEAHELRPMKRFKGEISGSGQFYDIFNYLKGQREFMLHGCTATPYRLNDGYIYGHMHAPGVVNYFDSLTYSVSYKELINGGYIVPPVFIKESPFNRSELSVDDTGDFSTLTSSAVMRTQIGETVYQYKKHLSMLKHNLAFCCDISHCEAVAEYVRRAGFKAFPLHSELSKKEQKNTMDVWMENGGLLSTVDQTTKGFDFPPTQGAMLLRPTKSTAICYQQIGRALRCSEGKRTAIIVDLCGNTSELMTDNNLDKPVVSFRSSFSIGGAAGEYNIISFKRTIPKPAVVNSIDTAEKMADTMHFPHGSSKGTLEVNVVDSSYSVVKTDPKKKYGRLVLTSDTGKVYIVLMLFRDNYDTEQTSLTTAATVSLFGREFLTAESFCGKVFGRVQLGVSRGFFYILPTQRERNEDMRG